MTLPTLTPVTPSAQPTISSIHANDIFASCLTCSFIAAFFSFIGKQWLAHYNTLGPTAHLENRKTLQCRLDGAIRWHFEGFVDLGLTSLLQVALIFFMAEWVAYLHAQGTHVSHPVNGISYFGIFLVILMLGCASWDRWCPYQTPYTTTIPQALWNSITHFSKIRLDFLQAVAAFRQLNLSGLRSHLQLGTFRRLDNTDELMDLRSLCWVLGNAPRGPSLLRVAQHITSICFCSSEGTRRERIMTSPHLFRIHETFWYLVMKIKRISRNNPENANDHVEILQHISIFGSAVICTSPQWTDVLHPLPISTMTDIFKASFDKHGPRNAADWKGQSPVLTTLNFSSSEFG